MNPHVIDISADFGPTDDGEDAEPMSNTAVPTTDELAVRILLQRALRRLPRFRRIVARGAVVIVVEVPDASFVVPVGGALDLLLVPDGRMRDGDQVWGANRSRSCRVVAFRRDGTELNYGPQVGNVVVADALASGNAVIGIAPVPERSLPADLLRSADHRLVVRPIDPGLLVRLIREVTGDPPAWRLSRMLCRSLSLHDLCLAVRPGSAPDECMRRLQQLLAERATRTAATERCLADLHGLGEARIWGEALARDLHHYMRGRLRWEDVDCGVLLSGPTGVGKTMFAGALARTCGCPLVSASLGEWQAAGHLGDLLKAMRRTFDEARKCAPCILFIDEIDSFGDRAAFDRHHRDYGIPLVNAFLEELDGVRGREGVVVVGATNNLERIDPAIRRPGRLDRTIELGLPDAEALQEIFRSYLGEDVADEDLTRVGHAAVGGTGADVARWVRMARRTAREAGRPLTLNDVMAELGAGKTSLSGRDRRRIALHEAGHALAAVIGGIGTVQRVSILGGGRKMGATWVRYGSNGVATEADCRRCVLVVLAGRAAEQVVLGELSTGSGGGSDSDLAHATDLVAAMLVSYCVSPDAGLVWRGPPEPWAMRLVLARNVPLQRRASRLLDEIYADAVALMHRHRRQLERIADLVVANGCIGGDELMAAIGSEEEFGEQRPDPAERRGGPSA